MSFREKAGKNKANKGLIKYSEGKMDWQEYLGYLDENKALSPNFIKTFDGDYELRKGYIPEVYDPKKR